ncbi:MAG: peptide deformylase [Alphaproteobacteria bacterium]|nr:peptide deformylase [Alphaproteobacteria bacterium]
MCYSLLYPVIYIPDSILTQTASPVTHIDDTIIALLDDMLATMYAESGIGLAANQIAVLKRLIVVDVSQTRDGSGAYQMINPEIISLSEETEPYSEGCLSIPGVNREVTRPIAGVFRYQSIDGEIQEIEADGLLARCIQHEIDHLNGILFIDHLSRLKRQMIWKSFIKKEKTA